MPALFKVFLITWLIFFSLPLNALALEISQLYPVEANAQTGDILVSSSNGSFTRANIAYDAHLFGVLDSQPVLVFKSADETGKPILRMGTASIKVTDINGQIKSGDYITSSQVPGYGQKADKSGYVLGTALQDFDQSLGTSIQFEGKAILSGVIPVALRIEYFDPNSQGSGAGKGRSIFDNLNLAFLKSSESPQYFSEVIRYITAGTVALIGFLVGFLTFSKSIPKSIEAIGRNPLAASSIRFSVILSIILTAITATIGIAAAIVILRI